MFLFLYNCSRQDEQDEEEYNNHVEQIASVGVDTVGLDHQAEGALDVLLEFRQRSQQRRNIEPSDGLFAGPRFPRDAHAVVRGPVGVEVPFLRQE